MAAITIAQLYSELRGAGYSDPAARGIIANAVYESGPASSALSPNSTLNYSATGDGGTSHGLLQWHQPGYRDMAGTSVAQQITYMGQTLPKNCLQMATAAQVAGCLAANFERCVGCQPGGAQYNGRVAAANAVARLSLPGSAGGASLMSSLSPGSAGTGSTGSAGSGSTNASLTAGYKPGEPYQQVSTANLSDCLLQSPNFLGIGGDCMLRKSNVRAILAIDILMASAVLAVAGAFLLFMRTGAGKTAMRAAGDAVGAGLTVFGAPELGEPVAAAAGGGGRAMRAARAHGAAKQATAQAGRQASSHAQVTARRAQVATHAAERHATQQAGRAQDQAQSAQRHASGQRLTAHRTVTEAHRTQTQAARTQTQQQRTATERGRTRVSRARARTAEHRDRLARSPKT